MCVGRYLGSGFTIGRYFGSEIWQTKDCASRELKTAPFRKSLENFCEGMIYNRNAKPKKKRISEPARMLINKKSTSIKCMEPRPLYIYTPPHSHSSHNSLKLFKINRLVVNE